MLDLTALHAATATHGPVARVVIAAQDGSAPRGVGTAMLVWADGQSGTIGGGALEWEAARAGRALLASGGRRLDRHALGPALGQCCGGAVTLLTEVFDASTLPQPEHGLFARGPGPMPLPVRRLLADARGQGQRTPARLIEGWFVEPVQTPRQALWIWGAGHVGRALVSVLAPLPDLALTWVDTAPDRFPDTVPTGVTALPVPDPTRAVAFAPRVADHLILTYSHALDLGLCHALLSRGFAHAGLIGSATKWARFRSRLAALGHAGPAIARIDCPIGNPSYGKDPQAIAIGVAAQILTRRTEAQQRMTG